MIFLLMLVMPAILSVTFGIGCARLRREADALKIRNEALVGRAQVARSTAHSANRRLRALLKREVQAETARMREGEIDYQSLYPDLICDAEQGETQPEDTVFFTFDDGPSERTAEILDILKKNNIKATFFVIGRNAATARGQELLHRIVDEGHTLGIHTYTHEYREIYASVADYLDDFYRTYALISEVTGETPAVFRFPGGSINSYNRATYQEIIAEMTRRGFTFYDWNVNAADTVSGADEVRENIIFGSKRFRCAIVLMHDNADKTQTVAALEDAIEALVEAGYGFDRLTPLVRPVWFCYKS